jgi:hypothetical protein
LPRRAIIKRTTGIGIAAPVQLAEVLRLGSVALIMAAGTGRPTGRAPQERLNGRSVPSKT